MTAPLIPPNSKLHAEFTRPDYEGALARVLEHIAAGDVYQVNLAQRFTAPLRGHPRELFQRLAGVSPAWYGAYLELGGRHGQRPTGVGRARGDVCQGQAESAQLARAPVRALCSTSPELFLEMRGREVTTRPIKGTRPAHIPARELRESEKDAAELHMITDLMRNDLGRVCEYGSVRVARPREIETHPTIHHAVSTITGRLHPSKDVVDLLRATFPGGSITGAPKVRAMRIIDKLEPVPRGPYCGCIGYLSKDEICLNIAIRTMLITPGRVSFSAGGGIVADSDPAAEYEETLDKAQAMIRALECES